MNKTAVLGILFALLVLGALVFTTMQTGGYRVEVCITFRGAPACRTASASTREMAMRTAVENTCAQISSGVTDSMQCQSTPPDKVRWLKEK